MNYHYTFIKVDQSITVSGSGNDPAVVMDIEWTSSPGAAAVLEQMNLIDSVYTPTIGFVSIDNYKNNMYVQIAKFGSIYKEGWRFENSNIPSPELDMVKSEILEKGKTKQRVYVKGSGKRKSYWRVQEVGREEIDPKKIENIWDIPLDQFARLVSGDKQLLKERYVDEYRYKSYESHPTLEYLRGLMSERIRYNINPSLSYFDESIMDIGGISRHEQAVDMALSADEEVPLHVLKDYPELATLYEIDISDSALIATAPVTDYTKLYEMPKDEYDRILDSVKIAYDTDPKHITDKMLNQDYEEELADCKRSAKLRKKLFNNLPEHMQYGYTPDTMDVKLHKSLVFLAKNNNIEIPTETKAGYPTIYTDQPFTYESTGNAECDTAANDILTHIRDSLGPDDFDTDTKISEVIYNIIGATGESVPMMYGVGIETESDMEIAESVTAEVSAALISPDLMARIKGFKLDVGRSRVMLSKEDDIRSYQLNGVIHLGEYDSKTLAHEYGHAIDWMLPEINELSQAFLNNRTEGDPLIPLLEIIPWGRYTEDEMTRPDNFMDSYIGKHYDHSSSEVLSMGMGYMMSSKSMMDMYEQDPEYLGYIVAVLSGRAQGAKVTKGPWSGSDEPGGFAPTNKDEIVEIDLSKLLNTSGLTRKRVLVRRKGEAPFWSTRWVHQGDTIKETVEAAGFELVAVESEESEKVDIRILVNEAIAAGKAAFEAGITMNDRTVPVRDEIIKRSDGSVKQELDIRDAWNTGWHTANAATLIPGLADDSAAAEARDKAEMDISWDIINPSYEAGKAAFKRGIKSSGGDFRLISILGAGNGTEATLTMVKKAWQRGWDEEAKKVPEPEPTPRVTLKSLMEKALDAGKEAFVAGSPHNEIMNDPKMVEILGQSSNLMHQLKLRENWLKGWAQAKETASANNFDTMPDVEIESDVETTSIPIADRVSGSKIIGGWSGTRPAVKVSDLQVGDIQLFTNGVALKIKEIRRSGKSYILTYEDYVNEETGKDWETKRQGRGMVGVRVPSVNVPDDFSTTPRPDPRPEPETKQLTAEDVMQPAYDAGGDAFKRGIDIKGGADDSDMINILLSIRHLPNYKQLEVMRRWMDGWQDAQKVATPDTKPTPEYEFVGTPLADRIDKKSKMRVPGIGTTPAITVGNVQIGDRLQFPEGVFRIKGVIVKGKSSTMIFEETDDKGNNLELKKQNRSWMAVEKTQLHPLGYIPSPNKPGVPHWARTKEVEPELKRKVTTFSSEGFTPVKTVAEGMERLQRDFIKSEAGTKYGRDYGLNLNGLKVGGMNSIIKGFDKVLGKYGIKLDYIGWNKRKQSGLAYYSSSIADDYNGVLFQKTATKGIKSREDRSVKNFIINKEVNIANCERHLTYPELRPGDHDRERDKIELLKACDRWTVDASFDDMLAATAAHEANHAVYDVYNLGAAWERNLTYLVGDKMNRELKCASVSEYGMSSMSELFAEVGSAVAFDIPIDPDVKQAYLDTIGSIKQ